MIIPYQRREIQKFTFPSLGSPCLTNVAPSSNANNNKIIIVATISIP